MPCDVIVFISLSIIPTIARRYVEVFCLFFSCFVIVSLLFPLFVFKSLSCCFRSLIDIVNLDVTTYNAGGYHGDLNETFCVGNVDADGRRLVQTAFECLSAALAMVRPGTLYRDLGTVIERTAKANQCSVVRTYCGHGIGSLFHTIPNVPHYAKNKAKGTMKEGEYDI